MRAWLPGALLLALCGPALAQESIPGIYGAGQRGAVNYPPGAGYTPTFLPTFSVSPQAVYGSKLLVSTYAGPLFQLTNSAATVTLDVCPGTVSLPTAGVCPAPNVSPSDLPVYSNIDAWAVTNNSGNEPLVKIAYDQGGGGLNATTVSGHIPPLSSNYTSNGIRPFRVSCQFQTSPSGCKGSSAGNYFVLPSGFASTNQAMGAFMVVWPDTIADTQVYFETYNAGTAEINLYTQQAYAGLTSGAGSVVTSVSFPRDTPQAWGLIADGSFRYFCAQNFAGTCISKTKASAATSYAGGYIGNSTAGGGQYDGMFDLFGFVGFGTAPTTADYTSFQTAATAGFSLVNSGFTAEYLDAQSSLGAGWGATRNQYPQRLLGLASNWEIYNVSLPGGKLTGANSSRTTIGAAVNTSYSSGPNGAGTIVEIDAPSNDIFFGSSGTYNNTLYSSVLNAQGADGAVNLGPGCTAALAAQAYSACEIFYGQTIPLVTYLTGLSPHVRVVVETMLVRCPTSNGTTCTTVADAGTSCTATCNYKEAARLAYDVLVKTYLLSNAACGTGGAQCAIADRTGGFAAFDTNPPTNTYFLGYDLTHLNDTGYAQLVTIDKAAILAAYAQ
ncbi:MAG TPA: hypothetical protein VG248_02785 [Caulobacteraceae bacterium]|jgi:hypothetical protein|nr:hypothetical protein [Caulobacteraceae bacterium]